jgi:ribonuclease P protein component
MVFNSGRSFPVFPFRVFYLFNETAIPLQAGFGVSTKNFKKAVERNRVKRLTREVYRIQKNQLQELLMKNELQLSVFFIYTGKELPAYTFVKEKIEISLQRLIQLVNEKTVKVS